MTARDRIAVLGSRFNIVAAALDLGLDVEWITDRRAHRPEQQCGRLTVHRADPSDLAALRPIVWDLHEQAALRRVFSLTEAGLVPAALLNEELGLGGNSVHTVTALLDKAAMREEMATAGLPVVRHRIVTGPEDTYAFLVELGGPCIIKPIADTGSRHVHRLTGHGDVLAAWQQLASHGATVMLAEELLVGREIGVESFTSGGQHAPIGFTDKTFAAEGSFVETGHTAPAAISARDIRETAAAVGEFLDALGVVDGPTHTELMLTREGPRIIESHTRIGGAGIADIVKLAYGVDLPLLTVGVPLGLVAAPEPLPAATGAAASRAVLPRPGRVTSITMPPDLPGEVVLSLDCAVGDEIPPLRSGRDKTAGVVVAGAADGAAAETRCEELLHRIEVVTVPTARAAGAPGPMDGDAAGTTDEEDTMEETP